MAEETTQNTESKGFDLKSLPMGAWIGVAVATLVIGILIGHFAMGGGGSAATGSAVGKSTLSESELSTVMATYTYGGATKQVTAKDVLNSAGTAEQSDGEEGTYATPTSDVILAYIQGQILASAAESEGVSVSDEDLAKFAEDNLGTSDYAEISNSYGMTEDEAKDYVRSSALQEALRNKVTGGDDSPAAPEAPEYKITNDKGEALSEEEQQKAIDEADSKPEKKYADYIIALVGDEWDAAANGWKSEDGEYAAELADYDISNDGATYEAAMAAYNVAYQDYVSAEDGSYAKWTSYVNDKFNQATVNLNTVSTYLQ